MKVCSACVLDDRFPGISFDDTGVCNFCLRQRKVGPATDEAKRAKYDAKFRALIEQHKGQSVYDCLVAYSGGKDSTYTLHLLREKYGVTSLAFSFDNWYQSGTALQNIKRVMKSLNVDHLTVMPRYETLARIIKASAEEELHPAKALERASAICTSCISVIRFVAYRMAIEQRIPFVVFGMSPGQAPLATSVVKANAKMVRATQEPLLERLRTSAGNDVESLFLEERHFAAEDAFPYNVNPLAFVEYDEPTIYDTIARYGWKKPSNTDANSSNCLLNAVANQVHIDRYGYNPYAYEVAELVRTGRLDREEGLARLEADQNQEHVAHIKAELEMD